MQTNPGYAELMAIYTKMGIPGSKSVFSFETSCCIPELSLGNKKYDFYQDSYRINI